MANKSTGGVFSRHSNADERLVELTSKLSQSQIAATLNEEYGTDEFTKAKVNRRQTTLGIKSNQKSGPGKDKSGLIRFMSKGRTVEELERKGISLEDLTIEGYELYETQNNRYEKVYLLFARPDEAISIQPKLWSYRWAVDPEGRAQPYLMVQLPKTNWDKIKVVPIADVHYGAQACMVEKLKEYIAWIASSENVFCFISGDLFENSHGDSNKGLSHYEQEVRPKDQVTQMCELLAPIAHKILWAIPGNHEDRSRTRDYDPLERLCERLEVPYSYEPIFVDVLWKGNVFSFHDQHGTAGGQTKGGKMNAAARPQEMQEHVMFTVMAHVHDGDVSRNTRIVRNRVEFYLEFKKQYIIICPSFFGYFGSYASKAGYKPGSYGSINMDLFANGDYHANS
jgi:predicted MPP superfamily phosphohydrolase